jgi:hypothetical protein
VAVGNVIDQACPPRSSPSRSRHIGLRPRLIEEDQLLGLQVGKLITPGSPFSSDVRTLLLRGLQDFF